MTFDHLTMSFDRLKKNTFDLLIPSSEIRSSNPLSALLDNSNYRRASMTAQVCLKNIKLEAFTNFEYFFLAFSNFEYFRPELNVNNSHCLVCQNIFLCQLQKYKELLSKKTISDETKKNSVKIKRKPLSLSFKESETYCEDYPGI